MSLLDQTIKLSIKGIEIEVTLAEARQLYCQLRNVFDTHWSDDVRLPDWYEPVPMTPPPNPWVPQNPYPSKPEVWYATGYHVEKEDTFVPYPGGKTASEIIESVETWADNVVPFDAKATQDSRQNPKQ